MSIFTLLCTTYLLLSEAERRPGLIAQKATMSIKLGHGRGRGRQRGLAVQQVKQNWGPETTCKDMAGLSIHYKGNGRSLSNGFASNINLNENGNKYVTCYDSNTDGSVKRTFLPARKYRQLQRSFARIPKLKEHSGANTKVSN